MKDLRMAIVAAIGTARKRVIPGMHPLAQLMREQPISEKCRPPFSQPDERSLTITIDRGHAIKINVQRTWGHTVILKSSADEPSSRPVNLMVIRLS
jgi:hypothetical protein